MIQLTWRQFRTQATVAFGALAVIAVVLAITGPQLVHLYYTSVVPCHAQGDCSVATSAFVSRDQVNADPFTVFDQRGIVPFGYAAFAFALGVTAGMLLRRTIPAMIATLVVFAGLALVLAGFCFWWMRRRFA